MNPLPKLTVLIVSLLAWASAVAQPPKRFFFTHYSTETGLFSNQVNSIVQDDEGFIWIATNDGLLRYDGTRYKTFRHIRNDSLSLPSNQVLQLHIDKKKNLWVLLTNGRAGIFDRKFFRFIETPVQPRNQLNLLSPYKKFVGDEVGNVFILYVGSELLRLDTGSRRFFPAAGYLPYDTSWQINDFAHVPGTRKYWFGVQNLAIAVANKETGTISYTGHNTEKEDIVERYGSLAKAGNFMFDSRGRAWFVHWDTLYSYIYAYDLRQKRPVLERHGFESIFRSYYEVNQLMEQRDGTIWLRGFKTFGHYREKEKRFELIQSGSVTDGGIDYRYITACFEDRELNVWVGTGNNGIFLFNPSMQYFNNVPHIDRQTGQIGYGSPLSFFSDKDGSILAGVWADGIYRYDKNFNVIPLGIKGIPEVNTLRIFEMYPSRDSQTVWFSASPGIYAYNQNTRSVQFHNPAVFDNRSVRQIAEDRLGNLWIGVYKMGVYKWNSKEGSQKFEEGITRYAGIPAVQIHSIRIDHKGLVWIASEAEGVYVIDPTTDSVKMHFHYGADGAFNLPEKNAAAILEYSDSLMLLATTTHVLLHNRITGKTSFITSDETISGEISSMEKDPQGNVWVSTTSALFKVNLKTRVMLSFNRHDGIVNDYFMLNSSTVLPDGRMMFGTAGQFIVFNPANVKVNAEFPKVTVTDFRLMNAPLRVDSLIALPEVELDHQNNSITVEFATLTYSSAYVIMYKLDGLDKEWKVADKSNQAIYSYLRPGKYRLMFRTIDAEGNSRDDDFSLAIAIDPPFYMTWLFYSLVALLLVAVLYSLDRIRVQRIRNEQQMRISIATNLHQDVNTTLRNINVLSEIASMKSGRHPQQAQDYLKEIQYKSRSMVTAMDDVLWSIDPANDRMSKIIEKLQEIADAMNSKHNSAISLQPVKIGRRSKMNMHTRLEFITIYKLMLAALVEQLGAVRPVVELECLKPFLQLRITATALENGAADSSVSKYITEVRSRAASIQANAEFEQGAGMATFLLEVKI